MAKYVDGFVTPVHQDDVAHYRRVARKMAKIWLEHGALSVTECVAEDTPVGKVTSFPRSVKLKDGETVVLSWITFRTRAHRDKVNRKVMDDPRIQKMMESSLPPFDPVRMIYGGFKTILDL